MSWDGKVNILLVDDQPAKLMTYEAILENLGENLIKAHSAREALEILLKEDIAVILTDVSMPELDGFELAGMIREHPRYRQTAIIFVSAIHMSDMDRLRGYQSGAVDYVSVPVVPEILRAKVAVFADLYRKSRQLELVNQELEQRVAILQSTSALVYVVDTQSRFVHVNRCFEQLFGVAGEQIPGKKIHDVVPHEFGDAFEANNRRVLAENRSIEFEESAVLPDGVHYYASMKGPIRDPDGTPQAVVGVSTDITDRKRLEEALRDSDRRKDEFLAMLAHELRNPLAPIRNVLQILRAKGTDDPETAWCRGVIGRQVDQLTRLVDDLLDVSRISRGQVKLQRAPIDLAAIVSGAVETSRPIIDARRHHLAVRTPEKPVWVEGDLVRLIQVVSNLLNNAAKYQNPGGRIWLTAERNGADALIRVRDNGLGIDPELLPKVFDMFARIERAGDGSPEGLGIGLSLSRSLVELHGGTIEVSSKPGESEFVVRLPSLDRKPESKAEPLPAAPAAAGSPRLRILVVDDNHDAAESLALLLRRSGHEVLAAHDGPSALETAKRQHPQVVLLDIGLPGDMDGYEVCRRMRKEGLHDSVIVALTGFGQDSDRRRSQEAGFDGHLVKPGDPIEIMNVLSRSARWTASAEAFSKTS